MTIPPDQKQAILDAIKEEARVCKDSQETCRLAQQWYEVSNGPLPEGWEQRWIDSVAPINKGDGS